MTSPGKIPWRTALVLFTGCWATVASPCSVSRVLDVPFSPDTYGFYGEVVGHVAMRIPECERSTYPQGCSPSWGLRIRILEPLNLPARDLTEVEYFSFGTGSDCSPLPVPQSQVQLKYPVGTRIALAGRLFTWDQPKTSRIRLTTLRPIVGEAIYTLPKNADLRSLAATTPDYDGSRGEQQSLIAAEDRSRRDFELWRDTLRLEKSTSENEALAILLRMASVIDTMGIITEDKYYTPIEQLVDRYLPTPAMRAELLRGVPAPGKSP